ncbi:MAG: flagellin lysine-N-methylase [Clostridia bacterium]|nr:flagellin lysine-N-methylase [Clostridia bacterium]
MKNFEFNYSKYFKCISSRCEHNCCLNWDISIDNKTYKRYLEYAKSDNRFVENKTFSKKGFLMDCSLRCPFLDEDNLCHIIKNYGEKNLSTTCKTHPRFKNFFSGITETGLGLCCEEASRIILSLKPKMKTILVSDKGADRPLSPFEKKVFSFRNKALKIIQDRKVSTEEKLSKLNALSKIDLDKKSYKSWIEDFYLLERLDKKVDVVFDKLKKREFFSPIPSEFSREFEQLLAYLTYRHLSRAIDGLDLRVRLAFIVLAFKIILEIFNLGNKDFSSLVESCRIFSAEIECSDQNVFTILNKIESLVNFIN